MSNRFALVIVAVAVPVAGFFLSQNSVFKSTVGTGNHPDQPEKRDFAPLDPPDPVPDSPPAPPAEPVKLRHDQEVFDQYSGTPVHEIIGALKSETPEQPNTKVEPSILDALPDAPFPFPADAKPRNEIALQEFVSTTQQGSVDDSTLLSRWQLNLAHIALGSYPNAVPETLLIPSLLNNPTEQFPVRFREAARMDVGTVFAVADFNRDGLDDLIGKGGTALWKNLSGESIPTELPPADGLYPADFDADGDVDIFATRRNGLPNSLWINEGAGTFVDFTEGAGLLSFADTRTALWGDFNRDGKLDLAVGNSDAPTEIFLSKGDGTFEFDLDDVDAAKVTNVISLEMGDLNNDGVSELLAFTATSSIEVLRSLSSVSVPDWDLKEPATLLVDFDNDSDLDLIAAGGSKLKVFQNDGAGVFMAVDDELGLPENVEALSFAVTDFDADGFLDLVIGTPAGIPNRAFWNRDGIAFREVTSSSGLGFVDATPDIFSSESGLILGQRMVTPTDTLPRLVIHLEKNSLGAKINVLARDHDWVLRSTHRIANGYQPTVIGMRGVKTIEAIEVVWPEGGTTPSKYAGKDIPPGSTIAIERGGDAVLILEKQSSGI